MGNYPPNNYPPVNGLDFNFSAAYVTKGLRVPYRILGLPRCLLP